MSVLLLVLLLCSLDDTEADAMSKNESCYFYENLKTLKTSNKG